VLVECVVVVVVVVFVPWEFQQAAIGRERERALAFAGEAIHAVPVLRWASGVDM
jgi:hypothetical protein